MQNSGTDKTETAYAGALPKEPVDANGLTEEEFLMRYDPDKYPKPSLTADILVFREDDAWDHLELLLIRRKGHPCINRWALPGGFAERGETIEQTAARELREETGVEGLAMKLVGVYSKPGRDPRGWTVSAAYKATVGARQLKPMAGDDAREVCWAKIVVPEGKADGKPQVFIGDECINDALAFDHYEIINDAVAMGK